MRKYAICRLQAAHKFEMQQQFKCDTAGNGWLLVVQRTMPTPSSLFSAPFAFKPDNLGVGFCL